MAGGLPVMDLTRLSGSPPEREFYWGQLIPRYQTTMLTGRGGIGKSLLTQQLLSAVALGEKFLGLETRKAKTLYVTAEDDSDELWRRQLPICDALGTDLPLLHGRLHLASLCGADGGTALGTFDAAGRIEPTPLWSQFEAYVLDNGIELFAFDNATDAMAGDLNDIHQVAEFVNMLTGLAVRCGGAGMILHHPNKAEQDWLGSVAWHNKVRSRLIIEAGATGDPDARRLSNPKSNYGPQGNEVGFRWFEGAFVCDEDLPPSALAGMAETARAAADNALFLDCLRERVRQRRAVSEKRGPTYAPTEFARMSEAKGITKDRLASAMDRLFRMGSIERVELWKGDDRKPVFGLRETAGNGAADTMRATQATVTKGAESGAGNAANTHTTPKGEGCAPPQWGAPSPDDWSEFDA